ncbi:hypothetical protein RXV86_10610 [Alisedimentitalea sp. MJ-SS2]|uniref:hypothetical protein n=1 Tax=Aliisedimentitalea sp. MJ-SS2 TaxID=3049795 RepID=UPI002908A9C5|nr:hypothetical protein [Alisedimentitalea sp. MJ-SS2]MDU8927835.1 hypothetical protein [Alisedimentitalea sp. MJ-SS2]
MSIAASLDDLRRDNPGCSLVAFGDLGTRLVLRASSDAPCAQEHYDRICAQAAQVFSSCDVVAEASGHSCKDATAATMLTQTETRIFVRSPADKVDFICCVCEPGHSSDAITSMAATALREISQEQKCNL